VGAARFEIEAMFSKTAKQTLGQLFGAIRDTGQGSSDLLVRLEKFVNERNWLVHRSRDDNPSVLYTTATRLALICRIDAIAEEALFLASSFQRATEEHLTRLGVAKTQIDADAARILKRWQYPDLGS
jgi:hypothetical protein